MQPILNYPQCVLFPVSCMSVCLVTALTRQVLSVNCGTYFVFKIAGLFFSLLLLK